MAAASTTSAQAPPHTLTLPDAERIALQNAPRIASANLIARAVGKAVNETTSAYYPSVFANVTAVGAERGTAVAAGALTTSSLFSRAAAGVGVSQLVTDFGRTANLTAASRLRFQAENENVVLTRAQILLDVDRAFDQTLGAIAVQKVAQAALENRSLVLRQVTALAASAFKSTLDVSFAQVAVSEAEMAEYQAENDVHGAQASLSAALGYERPREFTVIEEPLPPELPPQVDPLIDVALRKRPDLAALRLQRDAAYRFARAEGDLRRPTVSAIAAAGEVPAQDPGLHGNYGAAGMNVNIPIFNGGLYSAREQEARLRAEAVDRDIQDLSLRISRDVQVAWLDANNAFRRLAVSARLVQQANEALLLARARYEIGLGGIVELTQAQYAQTSAQIAEANARYEYLATRSLLNFAIGDLR